MTEQPTEQPFEPFELDPIKTTFTCVGCGAVHTPDGTPQQRAFVWRDGRTGAPSNYCFDCDGKLLDDPLPKPQQAA